MAAGPQGDIRSLTCNAFLSPSTGRAARECRGICGQKSHSRPLTPTIDTNMADIIIDKMFHQTRNKRRLQGKHVGYIAQQDIYAYKGSRQTSLRIYRTSNCSHTSTHHLTSSKLNSSDADCLPLVGRVRWRHAPQDDGYLTEAGVVPVETVDTIADLECVKV